jgi:uncharacterized membrane protein
MKKQFKTILKILAANLLSMILWSLTANASVLHLKNDDTAEVDITIEAGEGSMIMPDKEAIRVVLKEGEQKTVEITKKTFDKETFSVTGKVKMPSLYNRCGALLVDKNYKIIFTGSKTGGTICIAEVIN